MDGFYYPSPAAQASQQRPLLGVEAGHGYNNNLVKIEDFANEA